MIYLLLFLLTYFALTKKFNGKTTIILVLLLVTLILNEGYHNNEYTKSESFSNIHTYNNYSYNTTLNPFDYGRHEYKNFILPNKYNKNLEEGIICSTQKHILDDKILQKKLNSQHAYANSLRRLVLDEINELPLNNNVFNSIHQDQLTQEKICPSVCHIINDSDKCKQHKKVPVFKSEEEFNKWKNDNLLMCSSITNRNNCLQTQMCSFKNGQCFYDNKVCLFHEGSDQEASQCVERCENINHEEVEEVRKLKCDSAKLNSGEKYCSWDTTNNKCVSQCERFKSQDECLASSSRSICKWNTFANKCLQK
jgi:hypothetical protein